MVKISLTYSSQAQNLGPDLPEKFVLCNSKSLFFPGRIISVASICKKMPSIFFLFLRYTFLQSEG